MLIYIPAFLTLKFCGKVAMRLSYEWNKMSPSSVFPENILCALLTQDSASEVLHSLTVVEG